MTSEAQIQANRVNAQKSTGPRTPQGKALAAQNALKHGLLAQEVVIPGEDPGEFELYRQAMLAELAPAGAAESLLAERIVGLVWRLRRAERWQAAGLDILEENKERPKPVWSTETGGWVRPVPARSGPGYEHLGVARLVVQDFGQARVLERLLTYERRIEQSLYRTMAELRQVRRGCEQNPRQAAASAEPVGSGLVRASSMGILPVDQEQGRDGDRAPQADPSALGPEPERDLSPLGTDAHATEPPDGVTTNLPAADSSCETNPNSEGFASVKSEVSSGEPTLETCPGVTTNVPAAGSLCQTNPNSAGTGLVPENRLCETNPISQDVARGASAPATSPLKPRVLPRPRPPERTHYAR